MIIFNHQYKRSFTFLTKYEKNIIIVIKKFTQCVSPGTCHVRILGRNSFNNEEKVRISGTKKNGL